MCIFQLQGMQYDIIAQNIDVPVSAPRCSIHGTCSTSSLALIYVLV
jgi:hypothetical protein